MLFSMRSLVDLVIMRVAAGRAYCTPGARGSHIRPPVPDVAGASNQLTSHEDETYVEANPTGADGRPHVERGGAG